MIGQKKTVVLLTYQRGPTGCVNKQTTANKTEIWNLFFIEHDLMLEKVILFRRLTNLVPILAEKSKILGKFLNF